MTTLAKSDLLRAYDAQLQGRAPSRLPPGVRVERDGPLVRIVGLIPRGFIGYRDLAGLEGEALDDLIARQVRYFTERNEPFEWKLHGHDRPADLPARLEAHGIVPEKQETIVMTPVARIASEPVLSDGVTLREVRERPDLDRIAGLENEVWNEDHDWLAKALEKEIAVDPEGISIVVAEAGERVVCAAWVRFEAGTEFATLWGGATLAEWRRKGIYRAMVAYRANLARERGFRYLETDASDDSRPILERLGFVPVTTSTPYIWSPQS
jgi:GNAT superfamily N-acetyltransferase